MDLLQLFALACTVAGLDRASFLDHNRRPQLRTIVELAFADTILEKLGCPFDQRIVATGHIILLPSFVERRLVIAHRVVVGMLTTTQETFN